MDGAEIILMQNPLREIFRRDGRVLVLYFVLALALTYPLAWNFTTHGPGHGVDDPAQTWSLWWMRYALFDLGVSPLATDYIFFPIGINLVAYTPAFFNGVLSLPLQFAFDVIPAQNSIVFFALIAGGYGAYLLARALLAPLRFTASQRTLAAMLAGAFYAFGAWHINFLTAGHFMLLSNQWIPYFALFLFRARERPLRNGALAGIFLALNAWTELTFVPFLALLTFFYLLYLLGRGLTRRDAENILLRHDLFAFLLALGVVSAISISPFVISLLADFARYGYYLAPPGAGRAYIFSAEPLSFFIPSAAHPLLGAAASAFSNANTAYAFVGFAALMLAALGIFARGARVWAFLAVIFAALMLGPNLIIGEKSTDIPLPFAILRAIPLVNANRYPVRFNVMLMLALAMLIAFGAARLLAMPRGRGALAALIALLAFEQLAAPIALADLRVPPIYQTLREEPGDFAILDLPLGWRGSLAMQGKLDDAAQFYQTVHHKRLLGGITSRVPRFKFQYFNELPVIHSLIALAEAREVDDVRRALDREVARDILRFFDLRYVHVSLARASPALIEYARDLFSLQEIYRDDARVVYRVPAAPAPLREINPADETARLYFDDGWGRAQVGADGAAYRYATRGDAALWLPLARAETRLTLRLRALRAGQSIALIVNGQKVSEVRATEEWQDYAFTIPASVLRDGLNTITFLSETLPLSATRQDDYVIGATGVISPVDISVTAAGFHAGRSGEIFVAGRSVIPDKRGYHLVAIHAQTGAVERVASFDTFGAAAESARLAQFVAELPRGTIVAGAGIDDVSQNLQPAALNALRALGIEGDQRFQFRAAHAFIGVKGARVGDAPEDVQGRFPANVSVGKNVAADRAAFAVGIIRIEQ